MHFIFQAVLNLHQFAIQTQNMDFYRPKPPIITDFVNQATALKNEFTIQNSQLKHTQFTKMFCLDPSTCANEGYLTLFVKF